MQRLARRGAARLARAVDLVELEQADAGGARLDDQVGVPARGVGRVRAARAAAPASASRRCAGGFAARVGEPTRTGAAVAVEARLDVDRDDRALAERGHRPTGRLSTSEPSTSSRRPRTCGGTSDREAMLVPTASHSGPWRLITSSPLRRSAAPRQKLRVELLDRDASPNVRSQHRLGRARRGSARGAAACSRRAAGGAPTPRSSARRSRRASMPVANIAADERAHATAGDAVDPDAGGASAPRARRCARSRARRRRRARCRPSGRPGGGPGGRCRRAGRAGRSACVSIGSSRVDPAGERARAAGDVPGDEVAAAQLGPAGDRRRRVAAAARSRGCGRPAGGRSRSTGRRRRAAGDEDHLVARGLGAVEQRRRRRRPVGAAVAAARLAPSQQRDARRCARARRCEPRGDRASGTRRRRAAISAIVAGRGPSAGRAPGGSRAAARRARG